MFELFMTHLIRSLFDTLIIWKRGVATVYAVKAAGLAIGIGIGSSFIVLVSFVWGIFVFHESVDSKLGACFAILCMMVGLTGMSYFSSPLVETIYREDISVLPNELIGQENASHDNNDIADIDCSIVNNGDCVVLNNHSLINDISHNKKNTLYANNCDNDETCHRAPNDNTLGLFSITNLRFQEQKVSTNPARYSHLSITDNISRPRNNDIHLHSTESNGTIESRPVDSHQLPSSFQHVHSNGVVSEGLHICCGKVKLSKRQLGMCAAAFCGIYGGSILVPMKFADTSTKGTHYLLSFSIGASIVTASLWVLRYLYNSCIYGSFYIGYEVLPSFHFRTMWLAGGTSGLLWSIGNYFSLISVLYLGEGVGYPLVQSSILVSGLWGIFYFKEVTGCDRITKWLMSSVLTIFGILLLSYEHVKTKV